MSEPNFPRKATRPKVLLAAAAAAVGLLLVAMAANQALSTAAAQTTDDNDEDERSTVSTSGTATMKVDPDKVSVTVGVETDGATAAAAASNNSEMMNKVIAALKDLGITDDQLSTSNYSVYPIYEYQYPPCIMSDGSGSAPAENSSDASTGKAYPQIYPPPPECQPKNVITGYKASNSLLVTLDADQDVGKVIDTAVGAGANNVNGAYFFVSQDRQEQLRQDLIEKAIDNAKSRADKAAAAAGMTVNGVKSINLNDVYFPIFNPRVMAADAGVSAPTPILPGEQEINMTVQVTYFIG
jgi:uncharacterized protein YggE